MFFFNCPQGLINVGVWCAEKAMKVVRNPTQYVTKCLSSNIFIMICHQQNLKYNLRCLNYLGDYAIALDTAFQFGQVLHNPTKCAPILQTNFWCHSWQPVALLHHLHVEPTLVWNNVINHWSFIIFLINNSDAFETHSRDISIGQM